MNKDFLLNDSETFCMLPWIHMMMIPNGNMYPCCVAPIQFETDDVNNYGTINDDFDVTIRNVPNLVIPPRLAEKMVEEGQGFYYVQ